MDPPIQTEYFLSGGAMILILMVDGARAVISFCIQVPRTSRTLPHASPAPASTLHGSGDSQEGKRLESALNNYNPHNTPNATHLRGVKRQKFNTLNVIKQFLIFLY